MSASVAWITIAPVKALALESLEEVELTEGGLRSATGASFSSTTRTAGQQQGPRDPPAGAAGVRGGDRTARSCGSPAETRVKGEVSLGDEVETAFLGSRFRRVWCRAVE